MAGRAGKWGGRAIIVLLPPRGRVMKICNMQGGRGILFNKRNNYYYDSISPGFLLEAGYWIKRPGAGYWIKRPGAGYWIKRPGYWSHLTRILCYLFQNSCCWPQQPPKSYTTLFPKFSCGYTPKPPNIFSSHPRHSAL